jgi:hypothetical protein
LVFRFTATVAPGDSSPMPSITDGARFGLSQYVGPVRPA